MSAVALVHVYETREQIEFNDQPTVRDQPEQKWRQYSLTAFSPSAPRTSFSCCWRRHATNYFGVASLSGRGLPTVSPEHYCRLRRFENRPQPFVLSSGAKRPV